MESIWAFGAISDPVLRLALWCCAGALLLSSLLLLAIVGLRLHLLRNQRREQRFVLRWRPILLECLLAMQLPAAAPSLAANEQYFFLRLWLRLLETVRGDNKQILLQLARNVGCVEFSMRMLDGANRGRQLLAIMALGHLRERAAWEHLRQLAHAPDAGRSFAAMRALIQIAPGHAAEMAELPLLRDDWPLARVTALLQPVSAAFSPALLAALRQQNDLNKVEKSLRLLELLHITPGRAELLPWLAARSPAHLQVRALRVARHPQFLPRIRALCQHQDWRVRVQAAHALGATGGEQDLALLATMLSDAQWWVRYRAAYALLEHPAGGMPLAARLQEELSDRYAVDILKQAIAEHV
ncbi:HEAT repeat domain-containing protein [Massilia sp. W12]|uniref:HEAT repeat domain-containing protein n=1 Tax=Massilia sp. W12 TaxID=3126507 RepID=UPI0030CD0073